MLEVRAIVATSGPDHHIGYPDGRLIENDPVDRKWFYQATKNHVCIVGRKTMETLPPLKDRQLLVVTKNPMWSWFKHTPVPEGVRPYWVCDGLSYALVAVNMNSTTKDTSLNRDVVWIIGGNKLYESAQKQIDVWYITHYPHTVIPDGVETVKLSGFNPDEFYLEDVRLLDPGKSKGILHVYRRKKWHSLSTQ